MNKRKIIGTIVGALFWISCIVYFTYAYYNWRSENTTVQLTINDLSLECVVGANVNVDNIGPVLDYQDGVKANFSILNNSNVSMAIEVILNITSISENLLVDSFKYALVNDATGGTNYDYENPIIEGDFSNFNEGNNYIMQELEAPKNTTSSYQFIVYIDGNMPNDTNMQQNSLEASLLIGNCGGEAVMLDKLIYQAIYSETDNSLTFVHKKPISVGDTYDGKTVTAVYTGFDTQSYTSQNNVPWYKDGNYAKITSVKFDTIVSPVSTAYWFYGFSNLSEIDLDRLRTDKVTKMTSMFYNCSSLTSLDVSNFNTSKVTDMAGMFRNCSSLTSLDVSNFNTSNVTSMATQSAYAGGMFQGCSSLTSLDLSNFNTSKVTNMDVMFQNCSSLVSLNISNFDTTNVTSMYMMFYNCSSLISLNLSSFKENKVTNVYYMFANCIKLTSLNISNFDTSNITNMGSMFLFCSSLTSLDLSSFNTQNVTTMSNMFDGCEKLETLDLSGFHTQNVTDMKYMFQRCKSLTTLDLSNFVTSNVDRMDSMFYGCTNLTNLNISNFNTSNVTDMSLMFFSCSSLTNLNISNLNINAVTSTHRMFYNAYNITVTITVTGTSITNYSEMFFAAATAKNEAGNYIGQITVNYTSANSDLVDSMVATKSTNSNVAKGSCTNCVTE